MLIRCRAVIVISDLKSNVENLSVETSTLVTIFAIPKSFADRHTAMIQRNAIASWSKLAPFAQVILMGDDEGVREIADEFSIEHVADLKTNEQGTPLLSDAFRQVNECTQAPLIAYVNADIILLGDFVETMQLTLERDDESFLMIGRRTDFDIDRVLDFENENWKAELTEQVRNSGELAPVVCKDYFVFRRGDFVDIPAFAVGRGNWDNWMVAHAGQSGKRVIDATNVMQAIHQNHDYGHVSGGRKAVYVSGSEARHNEELAGGKNLVSGCESTFKLKRTAMGQELVPVTRSPFWSDLFGFLRLLKRIFVK